MTKRDPQPVGSSGVLSHPLILAALERAERHHPSEHAEPRKRGIGYWYIVGHLGLRMGSGTGRRLRPRLQELEADGLVSVGRRNKVVVYSLTRKGRRKLSEVGTVELPESPQHRAWREAKAAATERIQGFREDFQALLRDGAILLADDSTDSEAWYALADRMESACARLGSATHCLREWMEPSDDARDVDDRHYAGRRNPRYWDWEGKP
jgi:DNA-binding PadR family transcriptional regulator